MAPAADLAAKAVCLASVVGPAGSSRVRAVCRVDVWPASAATTANAQRNYYSPHAAW